MTDGTAWVLRGNYIRRMRETAVTQYGKTGTDADYADAQLWTQVAQGLYPEEKFPDVACPKKKKEPAAKKPTPAKTGKIQPLFPDYLQFSTSAIRVPEPPEKPPVRYIGSETEEESNRRTSELISDYNAQQEAARIAREIEEGMYSPPGTYGNY